MFLYVYIDKFFLIEWRPSCEMVLSLQSTIHFCILHLCKLCLSVRPMNISYLPSGIEHKAKF